jgi:CRP/FNR family transcriptional regulator
MARKVPKRDCSDCKSRLKGLFCDLGSESLATINQHKTTNYYQKGQIVFYEENQAFGLYCIYSGRVKLSKTSSSGRQQIVRIAKPGDLLGYRSVIAEEPYHATAEALEDCCICCIDINAFFETLAKDKKLARHLLTKLARELRRAEDLATSIAHLSVRERMAELLLMLKESYGKQTDAGILIELELSREEMAEMIGATQETAIRLLSEFKKDGYIIVKDRQITILDTKALIETAQLEQ